MIRPVFYKSFRSRSFNQLKEKKESLDLTNLTQKNLVIDIGFGTGESTIALSSMFIDNIVCGIECYKPGVKKLIDNNIHVKYGDALEIIETIRPKSVSKIYMLFPDPWQKIKHRKRRLLNDYSFSIIDKILINGGLFHFATDNINYAFKAKEIINNKASQNINFSSNRGLRPITKYEIKAKDKKNFVFDLIYIKR
jgi:tRNA (guanine-N7-)-methyltransferase